MVPALFIVAAAVLLYFTFTDKSNHSGAGTVVILLGIPVYYYFAGKKAQSKT